MNKNNIIILIISIYFFIQIFKSLKIYDKRSPSKYYNLENDNFIIDNSKDESLQPFNLSDVYEFGIYKIHPLKHPNDIDFNLAELRNGMNILDVGSGLLESTTYFSKLLPKSKIYSITKINYQNHNYINNKIKRYNNIKNYFNDFYNINNLFNHSTFDRILFIESINYSNDINDLFKKSFKLLKNNGKIYIRTIICPSSNKNIYLDIQSKLNCKLHNHDNIIYYLHNNGFKNIHYTSIPLVFSDNMYNPFFLLTINKLKLLHPKYFMAFLPMMTTTYIATKYT